MASKNIKGITIEIDGNTKPLSNALKDLNKDINAVNNELKNVDQALKLDPGNAEQVARKLELLEQKADLAQQKVERLKEAQKQMDAQGVDKASEEYKSLATELAKAEGACRKTAQAAEDTKRDFDQVSESTKLLNTYLEVTGRTADDLKNISGISKLVSDFKAGTLGAQGFDKVLKAVAQDATGSSKKFEEFKAVLRSINEGAPLEKIKQDLETISKANISQLGIEFDTLNQKSSALDSELKEINSSLKLDPSSLDLCAQKQEVLTQAVNNSEQKLTLLNQRFAELKATNIDLNDEEFRILQREIVNTETTLTGYKTQLTELETAQQRLDTYFNATGTSARNFANILGSELVAKIEQGKANSQELSTALDKIGASALANKGNLDQFKSALDSIGSGVSLANVKSELDSLGQKASETGTDIGGLKEQLGSIGEAVQSSALTDAADAMNELSEGARGVAESMLEASSQVQDSQNKIQVSLGATDEKTRELSENARNVYFAGYGESVDQASEAVIQLSQQLNGISGAQIEDLSKKVLTLSNTFDVDANEAIRGVSAVMKSFGLDADEAFDLVYAGYQNGLDYSGEFADNLAEYSQLFKDSGYSAEGMFNILQAGFEAGIYNNDKMNDLIKEFGVRMADGSVQDAIKEFGGSFESTFFKMKQSGASNEEMFQALVREVNNLSSEEVKATAVSKIFGTQGEDAGLKVFNAIGKLPDMYGDVGGAANQAVEDNNNSVLSMQRKWEEFKTAFAPIGEALAGVATTILDTLSPAIKGLSDWFTNLPGPIQTFIAVAGALVVGLAAIAPVVLAVVGAFAAIGPAITAAGGVMSAIAAAMSGPVVLAIAGVVAAIAGLVAVITNWDSICQWFQGMWDSFCTSVSDGWNRMCSGLGDWWNTTWTNITGFFSGAGSTVQEAWSAFCGFFSEAWNNIWNGIQAGWENTKNWFSTAFAGISDTVHGIWDSFCTNVQNVWNNAWSGIQSGWENTQNWFNTTFENVKSSVMNIWDNLSSGLTNTWNTLTSTLQNTWNSCKEKVVNIANEWKENFQKTFDEVKNKLSEIWNNIKSTAENTWNNIKSTVTGIVNNLKNGIQDSFNWAKEKVAGAWNSIKNTTSQVWENIKNTVRGAIDKLKSFFNFNWELPKIKLPHFNISGSFSLNPPQIPTFSVNWYKKGGILTAPTIFGSNGASLLGGGEAGAEAVAPIDEMYSNIDSIIDSKLGAFAQALIGEIQGMREESRQYYSKDLNRDTNIVMDSGAVVGQLAKGMDQRLAREQRLSRRR